MLATEVVGRESMVSEESTKVSRVSASWRHLKSSLITLGNTETAQVIG